MAERMHEAMAISRIVLSLACLAMLGACSAGASTAPTPTPTPSSPTPTPTPTTSACSYANRAEFVRATLDEWYLLPELLASGTNPAAYTDLNDYIDALVAPARNVGRDRYFTYLTSIAEENAFFDGGATGGFGFRLGYDLSANRVFVIETFEGTSALGANVDRGTELLAVGTSSANLVTVSSLLASGGPAFLSNALGPDDPGTTRVFRVRDQSGVTREVSLTKTEFALDPVSDRYGARIITDGGRQVGYLNLRTFIDPADPDLRAAFEMFRTAGVTQLVIDLRYNGGGAVSVAELFGNLMARNLDGQIYYRLALRPSKSALNETYFFDALSQSIAPTRIAFIGTGSTASASELVINGMQPYLGANMALVGSDTFGKPVGQFAFDLAACDDRLRAMAFQIENADGNGDYFDGLAATIPNTCRASDDISYQLGDPREEMLARALDFLAGRSCNPISALPEGIAASSDIAIGRQGLLGADAPQSVGQREVPGLN